MKRKILMAVLAIILIICMSGLIGCGEKNGYSGNKSDNTENINSDNRNNNQTEHNHHFIFVVTKPTCSKQGYTTYTCICGENYIKDYVYATGHTFSNNRCSVCKQTKPTDGILYDIMPPRISRVKGIDNTTASDIVIADVVADERGKYLPVTQIELESFKNCKNLTSAIIPDNVDVIFPGAFSGCSNLKSITLPNRLDILNSAFAGCINLKSVYYKGSEADKAEITIGNGNYELTSATWYYYSESQPTTIGNYWHYVDGVPTVWN